MSASIRRAMGLSGFATAAVERRGSRLDPPAPMDLSGRTPMGACTASIASGPSLPPMRGPPRPVERTASGPHRQRGRASPLHVDGAARPANAVTDRPSSITSAHVRLAGRADGLRGLTRQRVAGLALARGRCSSSSERRHGPTVERIGPSSHSRGFFGFSAIRSGRFGTFHKAANPPY